MFIRNCSGESTGIVTCGAVVGTTVVDGAFVVGGVVGLGGLDVDGVVVVDVPIGVAFVDSVGSAEVHAPAAVEMMRSGSRMMGAVGRAIRMVTNRAWATAEEKRNPVPSTFQGFSRSWVSLSETQNGKKCRGRAHPLTGVRVGETRRALPTPFDRVSTAVVHVRRRRRGREAGRCCEWLSVRRSVTRRARAAAVRR
jgi:hypothetical protein